MVGHQPAVAAYIELTKSEKQAIVGAILMQKVGANAKTNATYQELKRRQEEEGEDHKAKVKYAKMAVAATVRWKRTARAFTEGPQSDAKKEREEDIHEVPAYQQRILKCSRCSNPRETKHMQLRTADGYRGIYCKACDKQDRCSHHTCECDKIWHQCEIHRVDPPVHATRRGPRTKTKDRDSKGSLSSYRKAPILRMKAEKQLKGNKQGIPKQKDQIRHISFIASTNPPNQELVQRLRLRIEKERTDIRRVNDRSKEHCEDGIPEKRRIGASDKDAMKEVKTNRSSFIQSLRKQASIQNESNKRRRTIQQKEMHGIKDSAGKMQAGKGTGMNAEGRHVTGMHLKSMGREASGAIQRLLKIK